MTIDTLQARLTGITRELRQLIAQPGAWTPNQRARVEILHHELSNIQVSDDGLIECRAFSSYLATGSTGGVALRGLSSEGGAYPGSSGGPFAPAQFVAEVFETMKQIDRLMDPEVVRVVTTPQGGPCGIPGMDDTEIAATKVTQNSSSTQADLAKLGALTFQTCATWRTGMVLASMELYQDSGVPIDGVLSNAFAKRLQRGIGSANVATMLAGATLGVTAAGSATNTGGVETGATTVGTNDLYDLVSSIDEAWLSSPRCYWAMRFSTLLKLWRLLDKQGHPIIPPVWNEKGEPVLLGKPVAFCPSMPAVATGNKPIAFGDFGRVVVRLVSDGMRVQRYAERFVEFGQTAWEGFLRADCGLQITVSSPPVGSFPIKVLQNA